MKLKTRKTLNEFSGNTIASISGGPRRFATVVPSSMSVAILEIVGKAKGKQLFGRPIKDIGMIPSDQKKAVQVKVLKKNTREAAAWLKKRDNKGLGGDKDTICEFDIVRRPRGAKGKAIGIVKRCFVASDEGMSPPEMPMSMPESDSEEQDRNRFSGFESIFGRR